MVSELPSGWYSTSFSDLLCEPLRNGIYKQKEFHGRGSKIINMGELFAYPRLKNGVEMKRVELNAREKLKATLKAGDLIFARRSLTAEGAGKCSIVLAIDEETTFESSIIRARLDPEKANPEFYYYLFNSPLGKWLLGSILRQVAVSGITGSDLAKLQVPVAPLNLQNKIAALLALFDDKIELNRQINQTLEQIAQTIFKSWFVDFDPVKAKIAAKAVGRNPERAAMCAISGKTDTELDQLTAEQRQQLAATAALFPDELVESELGLVPRGWEVSNVGNEFDITMGQSPPGYTYNEIGEGTPFFQGRRDFGWRYPANRVYCTEPKRMANKGDTLISVRAPVGDINKAVSDCCIGRGLSAFRHKSGCEVFSYYSAMNLQQVLASYDSEGTVFGSINQKNLRSLAVVKPNSLTIHWFSKMIAGIDSHIEILDMQATSLATLRDTLLPKLLSANIWEHNTEFP